MAAKGDGNDDRRAALQKDVFNYAARFSLIPKFKFDSFLGSEMREGRFSVVIDLVEHGIHAAEKGSSPDIAFSNAILAFKRQAEEYCVRNKSAASQISARSLTTVDAHKFLKFYEIFHSTTVNFVVERFLTLGRTNMFYKVMASAPNGELICDPVIGIGKQTTVSVASLATAVTLLKKEPHLWPAYVEELRAGSGNIRRPVSPVSFRIDQNCLFSMRDTVQKFRQAALPLPRDPQEDMATMRPYRENQQETPEQKFRRNKQLKKALYMLKADSSPEMAKIRMATRALTVNRYRKEIIQIVNSNVYSIISADTGSGKTTQIPRILFDHAIRTKEGASCNIICTQPRRIAATSVAQRVAAERNQIVGQDVGYHIRFDCKAARLNGGMTYCTAGVLLAQLQRSCDDIFDSVSHILVDEVHERSLELDFLLVTIKQAVNSRLTAGRPVPHIVFMSATVDIDLFSNYFKNVSPQNSLVPSPHIKIPGRLYPVKKQYVGELLHTFAQNYPPESLISLFAQQSTEQYLEKEEYQSKSSFPSFKQGDKQHEAAAVNWANLDDSVADFADESATGQSEDPLVPVGLAAATVAHIARTTEDGAILVFVPGSESISQLEEILLKQRPLSVDFANAKRFRVIKLHSSSQSAQKEVFDSLPAGCRKIILSTNIAETSITIPEIRHVVDTGKVNEPLYYPRRRISKLACCWVSKSSSAQRAGRAGRVRDGNYYALFSKARFDSLRTVSVPEILRLDLQETCLRVRAFPSVTDIRGFLDGAIEPPSPEQVDMSIVNLQELGALDDKESLTPLGHLLSNLPLHPALGKMIVLGIIFRCLEPMILLGAYSSERDIFFRAENENRHQLRERVATYAQSSKSDHVAVVNALGSLHQARARGTWEEFTDYSKQEGFNYTVYQKTMNAAMQVERILADAGLIPKPLLSRTDRIPFGGWELNLHSQCEPLIKAILLSGLFPNLGVKVSESFAGWRTEREALAIIATDSVNYDIKKKAVYPRGTLITFSALRERKDRSALTMVRTSEITPLMACLFGGRITGQKNTLQMDRWLPFNITAADANKPGYIQAKMVVEFRKSLDKLLHLAFQDLTTFSNAESGTLMTDRTRSYLADDPVRDAFARSVVELLKIS